MRLLAWMRRFGGVSCAEVRDLVQCYLDDELDETRAAMLTAHLHRCKRCGVEAETYRRMKVALAPDPPPATVDRLRRFALSLGAPRDDVQGRLE